MARSAKRMMTGKKSNTVFSEGYKSKGILDDFAIRKVVDTAQGTIDAAPVNPKDIVNKAYADGLGAGAETDPHWTTQSGAYTKTTDFDSLSGAYVAHAADDAIHFESGAFTTHIADSTDPHGVTLTQTNVTSSGQISGGALIVAGDHDRTVVSGGVVNVYYGTGATAPTANTTTLGSLYIQYTA